MIVYCNKFVQFCFVLLFGGRGNFEMDFLNYVQSMVIHLFYEMLVEYFVAMILIYNFVKPAMKLSHRGRSSGDLVVMV